MELKKQEEIDVADDEAILHRGGPSEPNDDEAAGTGELLLQQAEQTLGPQPEHLEHPVRLRRLRATTPLASVRKHAS